MGLETDETFDYGILSVNEKKEGRETTSDEGFGCSYTYPMSLKVVK